MHTSLLNETAKAILAIPSVHQSTNPKILKQTLDFSLLGFYGKLCLSELFCLHFWAFSNWHKSETSDLQTFQVSFKHPAWVITSVNQ